MSLQADWKSAKDHFKKSTGKKKPDAGFFSHASGLDSALGKFDKAMEAKAYPDAKSALAAFDKAAAAYSEELQSVAGKAANGKDYNDRVKELDRTLEGLINKAGVAYKTAVAKPPPPSADMIKAGHAADEALKQVAGLFKTLTECVRRLEAVVALGPMSPKFTAAARDVEDATRTLDTTHRAVHELLAPRHAGIEQACKAAHFTTAPKEWDDRLRQIAHQATLADALHHKGHAARMELDRLHQAQGKEIGTKRAELLASFHALTFAGDGRTGLIDFPRATEAKIAKVRKAGTSSNAALNRTYDTDRELKELDALAKQIEDYRVTARRWLELRAAHEKLLASVAPTVKEVLLTKDAEVAAAAAAYQKCWTGLDLADAIKALTPLTAALNKARGEAEAEAKYHHDNAAEDIRREAVYKSIDRHQESLVAGERIWGETKDKLKSAKITLSGDKLGPALSSLFKASSEINRVRRSSLVKDDMVANWRKLRDAAEADRLTCTSKVEAELKAKAGSPAAVKALQDAMHWLQGIGKMLEEVRL